MCSSPKSQGNSRPVRRSSVGLFATMPADVRRRLTRQANMAEERKQQRLARKKAIAAEQAHLNSTDLAANSNVFSVIKPIWYRRLLSVLSLN